MKTAVDSAEVETNQQVSENADANVAFCVARITDSDPDLAKIVAAWPTLPEPIRRAMLALIG